MTKRKLNSLPTLSAKPPPSEIVFDENGEELVLFKSDGKHGYKHVKAHRNGYMGADVNDNIYTGEFSTPREAATELAKKKKMRELALRHSSRHFGGAPQTQAAPPRHHTC